MPPILLGFVLLASPVAAQAEPPGGHDWLRAQLPTASDRPGYLVVSDYEEAPDVIIPGQGRFFDTVRDQAVRSAHLRSFLAFDGSHTVSIRLAEWTSHASADSAATDDEGHPVLTLSPAPRAPGAVTVRQSPSDAAPHVHVGFSKGRVGAEVLVRAGSVDMPLEEASLIAVEFADNLYSLLQASPDIPGSGSISLRTERFFLFGSAVAAYILFQLLGAAVATVRDPAWRRLVPRSRGSVPTQVRAVDLTSAAQRRRWRTVGGVVARNLIFIALLTLIYFGTVSTVQQALWFFAVALVYTWGESVLSAFTWRRTYRTSTGFWRSFLRGSINTLALAVATGGANLVFVSAVSLQALPPWGTVAAGRTAGVAFALQGVGLIVFGGLLARLGVVIAMSNAENLVKADGRDEILFLRSFMDDALRIRAHRTGRHTLVERLVLSRLERFEEILTWQLWRHGPVVALAQPDQALRPLGAARLVATAHNWLSVVDDKIAKSQFVVMNVGRTSAVTLEVQRLRAAGALNRTIFVLPPVGLAELDTRLAVVAAALELERSVLTPSVGRHLIAFYFDPNGEPVLLQARKRGDLTYDLAIGRAAKAVLGQRNAHLSGPATQLRHAGTTPDSLILAVPPPTSSNGWLRWVLGGLTVAVLCCGLPLAVEIQYYFPPAERQVPLPGTVLVRTQTASLAADGHGGVDIWDLGDRQLKELGPSGESVSLRLGSGYARDVVRSGDVIYVVMAEPNRVVAVQAGSSDLHPLWEAELSSAGYGLAFSRDQVFVTLPEADAVAVLSATDGTAVGQVNSGAGPLAIVAAPSGAILVANVTDGTVARIDPMTLDVVGQIDVAGAAALAVGGDSLIVTSVLGETLSVFDDEGLGRKRSADVPRPSGPVAVVGDVIVVATYESTPRLIFLDHDTLSSRGSVELPSQVADFAVADGRLVCAVPEAEAVISVQPGTLTLP